MKIRKVILICAVGVALLMTGCGEKVTNYSANALQELQGGKAPSEVFTEDTVTGLLSSASDTQKKIVSKYLGSIAIEGVSIANGYAQYVCQVKDVSGLVESIVDSDAFKTEVEKRSITGDFDEFEEYIYGLALQGIDGCSTKQITVVGYLDRDQLLTSAELMQPLVAMFSTEIPTKVEKDSADVGDELTVVSGDFVTAVKGGRILIYDVEVLEGNEAAQVLQKIDAKNSGAGVFVRYKVKNLSSKNLVVDSRFYGVSNDYKIVLPDVQMFGLMDTVRVKPHKSAEMEAYACVGNNGLLVWSSETAGSYFYQSKGVEGVE